MGQAEDNKEGLAQRFHSNALSVNMLQVVGDFMDCAPPSSIISRFQKRPPLTSWRIISHGWN